MDAHACVRHRLATYPTLQSAACGLPCNLRAGLHDPACSTLHRTYRTRPADTHAFPDIPRVCLRTECAGVNSHQQMRNMGIRDSGFPDMPDCGTTRKCDWTAKGRVTLTGPLAFGCSIPRLPSSPDPRLLSDHRRVRTACCVLHVPLGQHGQPVVDHAHPGSRSLIIYCDPRSGRAWRAWRVLARHGSRPRTWYTELNGKRRRTTPVSPQSSSAWLTLDHSRSGIRATGISGSNVQTAPTVTTSSG